MAVDINEILSFLDAGDISYKYYGKNTLTVDGYSPVSKPKIGTMTWIRDVKLFDVSEIENPGDLLVFINEPECTRDIEKLNVIIADDPKAVFFEVSKHFFPVKKQKPGISPTAIVETDKIGKNISIGHNSYICEDAVIGDNVTIKNNVVIDCPAVIGDDCLIDSGVIIGTVGFGYYTLNDNRPRKVPDYGGVRIGNRVDIGANSCIGRGTLTDTIIEDDVKIGNLCHVAHNVQIKERCYMPAMNLVAGSSIIEEDVYIGPCAVVVNQVKIGRNSFIGMGSVVMGSVDENKVVAGVPARVLRDNPDGQRPAPLK